MAKKWIYLFDELDQAYAYVGGDWENVRGLLGGKGANLAEMTRIAYLSSRFHGDHRSL